MEPVTVDTVAAPAVRGGVRAPHALVVRRDGRDDAIIIAGFIAIGRKHIEGIDMELPTGDRVASGSAYIM